MHSINLTGIKPRCTTDRKVFVFQILRVLIPLCIIAGCAGTTDRGPLSEAVEKSRDNHQGERRVENSYETDTSSRSTGCLFGFLSSSNESSGRNVNAVPEQSAPVKRVDKEPDFTIPEHHYFGIRAVSSNRFSKNYTHSAGGAVIWLNRYKQKRAIEMSLHYEAITTGEKSPLYGSLDNLGVVSAGVHNRYFTTPDITIMGLYFKGGIDVSELFWTYRNPLTSDVYDDRHNLLRTDVIYHDGLTGFCGDVAVGWSFLQTKKVNLSIEALLGGTLFWFKTYQGFSNDMFDPDAYVKIHLEILVGSGE